jgi:large subunit ribosomal protein L20
MPRATNSAASRKRRKRILLKARGFRSATLETDPYREGRRLPRRRQWAYRDRKVRKRSFRGLWIQRINAGAKLSGMTYSRFHGGPEGR